MRTRAHKRGHPRVNARARPADESAMRAATLAWFCSLRRPAAVVAAADRGAVIRRPGTFGLNAVWAFAPDDVWAGGELMLHFDGTAFTRVATPQAGWVTDFLGFAPDDLYAVAGAGLLHWDGAAWSAVDFGGTISPSGLTAIWGTSASDLWLGDSSNGRVHRWNGTTWSTTVTQVVEVTDIWGSSSSDVYVSGIFGLSHWNGTTWTESDDFLVDHSRRAVGLRRLGRLGGERDRRAGALGRRRVDRHAAARRRSLPGRSQQGVGQRTRRRLGGGQLRRAVALGRRALEPDPIRQVPRTSRTCTPCTAPRPTTSGRSASAPTAPTPTSSCTWNADADARPPAARKKERRKKPRSPRAAV